VVPEFGHLLAICVYVLPEPEQFWKFTLEMIEDLFEIKASAGSKTSISLILIEKTPIQISLYNFELMNKLSDNYLLLRSENNEIEMSLKNFISEIVKTNRVKQENEQLWNTDAYARVANETRISDHSPVSKLLKDVQKQDFHKPSLTGRSSIIEKISFLKTQTKNYSLFAHPKVNNIKDLLIGSANPFYFTFDFGLMPGVCDTTKWGYIDKSQLKEWIGMGCAFVNVMRGTNTVYPYINFLRRMATCVRFISYQSDGNNGTFDLLDPPPKMYLVIDGTVAGPAYDPLRYLRMLISSGWTPISLQDFIKKINERGL
jgi:hypothetical protein